MNVKLVLLCSVIALSACLPKLETTNGPAGIDGYNSDGTVKVLVQARPKATPTGVAPVVVVVEKTEPCVSCATPAPQPAGVSLPSGIVCWHGREGRGEASGHNLEYLVHYPGQYVGTLQWWAVINWKDEWGNDSLKGCLIGGQWWNALSSFPKASWLDTGNHKVCENDGNGCGSPEFPMMVNDTIPEQIIWLMNNGNSVSIPSINSSGITVIRWAQTSDLPANLR